MHTSKYSYELGHGMYVAHSVNVLLSNTTKSRSIEQLPLVSLESIGSDLVTALNPIKTPPGIPFRQAHYPRVCYHGTLPYTSTSHFWQTAEHEDSGRQGRISWHHRRHRTSHPQRRFPGFVEGIHALLRPGRSAHGAHLHLFGANERRFQALRPRHRRVRMIDWHAVVVATSSLAQKVDPAVYVRVPVLGVGCSLQGYCRFLN